MPESLTLLRHFVADVASVARRGDATEASFYPALQRFLEDFGRETDRSRLCVTTLPKKTDAGNPDFRIWDGGHTVVGYVEAKPLEADLDAVEKTEQLRRYRSTFPNLVLTNFLEFRLYRNGQRVRVASLAAQPNLSQTPKLSPHAAKRVWVTLLNPAADTMTFVVRAAQEAVREFTSSHGSGAREVFIREHVLRNFYAFELMVAPYTIGHMKMAFYLQELGLPPHPTACRSAGVP